MNRRFDAILGKKFNAPKCKTLLKLTVARLKVLRNKRENGLKQMRTEVAKLLEKGQENSARIKVENVWREKNIILVYDALEQYCEHVTNRLTTIEAQKKGSCPEEVKEAIASIVYAASQCDEVEELKKVQNQFSLKCGKEFIVAALEKRPDCGVNLDLVHKLSVQLPKLEVKLSLLKDIAVEHNVVWDAPKAQEKTPEELLERPNKLSSLSKKVQHKDSAQGNSLFSADVPMEKAVKVSHLGSTVGIFRSCSPSSLSSEDTPMKREESISRVCSGSVVGVSGSGSPSLSSSGDTPIPREASVKMFHSGRRKAPSPLSPSEDTPMAREASIKGFSSDSVVDVSGSGSPSSVSSGDAPMAREALVNEFHSGSNGEKEREKVPPPKTRQGERRGNRHLANKSGDGISSNGKVESPSYSTEEHSFGEEVGRGEYRDIAHAVKVASELAARAAIAANAAHEALALAVKSNLTSDFMAEPVSPRDLDSRVCQNRPESHPLMKPPTERASSLTLSFPTSPARGDAFQHLRKEPSWKNSDHQDLESSEDDGDFNASPWKFNKYEDENVEVEKVPDITYPSRQKEKDPFRGESWEEGSRRINSGDGTVNVGGGMAPSQTQKPQFDDYCSESCSESDENVLNLNNNRNVASSPINSEGDEFDNSLGRNLSESRIASKPHLSSLALRSSNLGSPHRRQDEFSSSEEAEEEAEEEKEPFYKKPLRSPRQLRNLYLTNSPFTDPKFRDDLATYDDYMSSEELTKKHLTSCSSQGKQHEYNTNLGLSFRGMALIGDEDDHSDSDKDTRNCSDTISEANIDFDEIGCRSPLPPYVEKDSDSEGTVRGKGKSRVHHSDNEEYDSQRKSHHSQVSLKATRHDVRMVSPTSPKLKWSLPSSNDDNDDYSDVEVDKQRMSNTRHKQKGGGISVYYENEMEVETNAKKDRYLGYNAPLSHPESYPLPSPSVRSHRSRSPREPPSPRWFPDTLTSLRQPCIANTTTKGAFSTTHVESTPKLKWQSRASDLDEDDLDTQNESRYPILDVGEESDEHEFDRRSGRIE